MVFLCLFPPLCSTHLRTKPPFLHYPLPKLLERSPNPASGAFGTMVPRTRGTTHLPPSTAANGVPGRRRPPAPPADPRWVQRLDGSPRCTPRQGRWEWSRSLRCAKLRECFKTPWQPRKKKNVGSWRCFCRQNILLQNGSSKPNQAKNATNKPKTKLNLNQSEPQTPNYSNFLFQEKKQPPNLTETSLPFFHGKFQDSMKLLLFAAPQSWQ